MTISPSGAQAAPFLPTEQIPHLAVTLQLINQITTGSLKLTGNGE